MMEQPVEPSVAASRPTTYAEPLPPAGPAADVSKLPLSTLGNDLEAAIAARTQPSQQELFAALQNASATMLSLGMAPTDLQQLTMFLQQQLQQQPLPPLPVDGPVDQGLAYQGTQQALTQTDSGRIIESGSNLLLDYQALQLQYPQLAAAGGMGGLLPLAGLTNQSLPVSLSLQTAGVWPAAAVSNFAMPGSSSTVQQLGGLIAPMPPTAGSTMGDSSDNSGTPNIAPSVLESMPEVLKINAVWATPFIDKGKKDASFPMKLHQILANPEFNEYVTWNPNGKSWRILKPPMFESVVIPLWFRHGRYGSFMRQVNGWGFKRITSGNEHNSYSHEYFVRDKPELCLQMSRKTKKAKAAQQKDSGEETEDTSSHRESDSQKESDSLGQADCSSNLGDDVPPDNGPLEMPRVDLAGSAAAVKAANPLGQPSDLQSLIQQYGWQGFAQNPSLGAFGAGDWGGFLHQQPSLQQMNMIQGLSTNSLASLAVGSGLNQSSPQSFISGFANTGFQLPVSGMSDLALLQGIPGLNSILSGIAAGQLNSPPNMSQSLQQTLPAVELSGPSSQQGETELPKAYRYAGATDTETLRSLAQALRQAQRQNEGDNQKADDTVQPSDKDATTPATETNDSAPAAVNAHIDSKNDCGAGGGDC